MKLATFAAAAVIAAASAHAEEQVYLRHCTHADHYPSGMNCKMVTDFGNTRCESRDKTIWVTENVWGQQNEAQSPKCTISVSHKTNPPCVVDPAPNEPTCNFESRMAVAKRHGFEDMAHASMTEAIQGSERLQRERDKVYKACMARNDYCEYRD